MGLFKFIKSVKEELKRNKNCKKMSVDELRELSDEDLREALSERLRIQEDNNEWDVKKCVSDFKGAKRVYYIVNYFDMEVQNGGLCQFFVNSSRDIAPYILKCLLAIGAVNYEKLLREFVEKNDIDLNDLESFMIEEIEEYEAQTQRYPFDDFDDKYYELYETESLEDMLLIYAKQNLNDFETC